MPRATRWVEMVAQVEALKLQVKLLTTMVNALNGVAAAKMPSSAPLPPLPPPPQ